MGSCCQTLRVSAGQTGSLLEFDCQYRPITSLWQSLCGHLCCSWASSSATRVCLESDVCGEEPAAYLTSLFVNAAQLSAGPRVVFTATAEECISILIVFCNCYTCLRDNCTGHANDSALLSWHFTGEHTRRAMLSTAGGHERCRANEKVNKVCGGMFTSGHPSQTEDNK